MQGRNREDSEADTYDGMHGDEESSGRVGLRTFADGGERWQYHWLLLVPLLALGYGFYTQFDRVREMLTPDPVVEATPSPAPVPASSPAEAVIEIPTPVAEIQDAPKPWVEPPSERAGERGSAAQTPPPLPTLYSVPAEPVRTRTAGKAGLVESLRNGELRLATAGDFGRWKSSHARNGGVSAGRAFDEHVAHMEAYVVQKDFEIPDGLAGADAVVLLVESRAPFPRGDAGHSPILDIQSGTCVGVICRMLMPEESR
ncbi:MAG: hypothetical protein ABWY48_07545 [Pseudoxanthomonas sp.]